MYNMHKRVNTKYWAEAVNTAVYLKNRSPNKALLETTPELAWSGGDKVNLSHLRVFGSRTFASIPKEKRCKWDQNSRELIFVGYCEDSKAYRLVDPKDPRKIVKARDVEFIEVSAHVKKKEIADVFDVVGERKGEETTISEQPKSQEDENVNGNNSNHHSETENENSEGETKNQVQERHYPKRERKRKEITDMILYQAVQTGDDEMNEPAKFNEAIKAVDADKWKHATEKELQSLEMNKVWDLVEPPNDKQIMTCKWVYKLKKDTTGNIVRYKARLVTRGFNQKFGAGYNETLITTGYGPSTLPPSCSTKSTRAQLHGVSYIVLRW
jgi:hypothetical protein